MNEDRKTGDPELQLTFQKIEKQKEIKKKICQLLRNYAE